MKLLLSTALILSSLLPANAQTKLAIKAGFNYSTARAYLNDVKQSVGFVPGGNLAIQLKTVFDGPLHFSPYIAYSTRGYIIKKGNANGDKMQTFIHYIDLAPVLSLDFKTGGHNSFVISVGPLGGLAISGKEKNTIAGVTTSSKMKFSTSSNYGLFDLALHTSIGYHFEKFFVEAAYQYGFTSINNEEQTDKNNIRNRTLSLNVGYYFKSYN